MEARIETDTGCGCGGRRSGGACCGGHVDEDGAIRTVDKAASRTDTGEQQVRNERVRK